MIMACERRVSSWVETLATEIVANISLTGCKGGREVRSLRRPRLLGPRWWRRVMSVSLSWSSAGRLRFILSHSRRCLSCREWWGWRILPQGDGRPSTNRIGLRSLRVYGLMSNGTGGIFSEREFGVAAVLADEVFLVVDEVPSLHEMSA